MAETPAWAVDGGRSDAASARRLAWNAVNGNSGVTLPTDLKVTALATPGPAVNIAPGGASIVSTYSTAGRCEAYEVGNDATRVLPIPASGAGASQDLTVIARIDDWHFNQSPPPADPLTANYWRFEAVATDALAAVIDPYISLARIKLPASTATVTDSMIEDVRKVARVQELTRSIIRPAVTGDTGLALNAKGGVGEVFPNIGNAFLDVPPWATRMQIRARWASVLYASNKNPYGLYWVEYGPHVGSSQWQYKTQEWAFDSSGTSGSQRLMWYLADDRYIPAALRGTQCPFVFKARYNGDDKGVSLTPTSGVDMEVRFMGVADTGVEEAPY